MTKDLLTRLWVARVLFAVTQIGSAAIAFVATQSYLSRDGELSDGENDAVVVLGVCLVGSAIFVWIARNRPRAWQNALSYTGAVVGVLAAYYMVSRPVSELADSPLHLSFQSRRNRDTFLTVGPATIRFSFLYRREGEHAGHAMRWQLITDVVSVKKYSITNAKDYVMRDGKIRTAENSPGPALRIQVSTEVWTFPTTEPDRIGELIRLRIARRQKQLTESP